MHTFILRFRYALGDTVLVTALVRDIHLKYPGQYRLMVDTHWAPVWHNNPHVVPLDHRGDAQVVVLDYRRGIRAAGSGHRVHFLSWLHVDFEMKTGLAVPVTLPRGELFLDESEKRPPVDGRYWVVVSGGKLDMTTKHPDVGVLQEAVDALRARGLRFVQAGAVHRHHVHPPLRGVLTAVGRTEDVRDLFALIHHSDGVLCPVTAAMHVAACFDKPCVVVAGGREEPWWEEYSGRYYPTAFGGAALPVAVEHRFLHTLGRLECCKTSGCWKQRTVALEPGESVPPGDQRLCVDPVRRQHGQAVPRCISLIRPEDVVAAVLSYGTPPARPGADLYFTRPPSASALDQDLTQKLAPQEILKRPGRPCSLDHPILGGKLTVFVLCWGPHPELARRCLDGILKTVPRDALDLRVGCNTVCPETLVYLKDQPLARLYDWPANPGKYPAMRAMFHDPACPVQTKYLLWFDDDSFVVDPLWLEKLCDCVVANHPHGCRLYGWKHLHDFSRYAAPGHRPDLWFRRAAWYRGVDFRLAHRDRPVPNGSVVAFAAGGFWALCTETMRQAGIPDDRLVQDGGDICLGEQVRQCGAKIASFGTDRTCVYSPGHPPRGLAGVTRKHYPWSGPTA